MEYKSTPDVVPAPGAPNGVPVGGTVTAVAGTTGVPNPAALSPAANGQQGGGAPPQNYHHSHHQQGQSYPPKQISHNQGPEPRTLYVGNLDHRVNEDLIKSLFGSLGGQVVSCKIIRDHTMVADPYCFVELATHQQALATLTAMNRRKILDKEIKVNWAVSSTGTNKHQYNNGQTNGGQQQTNGHTGKPHYNSNHNSMNNHTNSSSSVNDNSSAGTGGHHIFVGDLSPEIDTDHLREAFSPYGEISDCRVVKDMTTQKSKGYGFVSFARKPDAQTAIEQMNGHWIGSRAIRTNWATRKPPSGPPPNEKFNGGGRYSKENGDYNGGDHGGQSSRHQAKILSYDEVFALASDVNFTVYVGNVSLFDEETLRRTFTPFGRIVEIRHFRDKGYAFMRYDNKESACNAIVSLNGTDVNGQVVKCSWGKEGGGQAAPNSQGGQHQQGQHQGGHPPHQQGGGHPHQFQLQAAHAQAQQAAHGNNAAAVAAAISQQHAAAMMYGIPAAAAAQYGQQAYAEQQHAQYFQQQQAQQQQQLLQQQQQYYAAAAAQQQQVQQAAAIQQGYPGVPQQQILINQAGQQYFMQQQQPVFHNGLAAQAQQAAAAQAAAPQQAPPQAVTPGAPQQQVPPAAGGPPPPQQQPAAAGGQVPQQPATNGTAAPPAAAPQQQ